MVTGQAPQSVEHEEHVSPPLQAPSPQTAPDETQVPPLQICPLGQLTVQDWEGAATGVHEPPVERVVYVQVFVPVPHVPLESVQEPVQEIPLSQFGVEIVQDPADAWQLPPSAPPETHVELAGQL
ncbi:MAG: hypothetical protein M1450_01295 [Patescibacteria group bacterium]|nr:hypothetical protein [Patescibacteria group bacterium]